MTLEICSSAHWNAESGMNLLITLKECNGMSQHCPVKSSNSKQEKHHVNNFFIWGNLVHLT